MSAPKMRGYVNGFEERPIKRRRAYVTASVQQELPLGESGFVVVRFTEAAVPPPETERSAGWPTLKALRAVKRGSRG